MATETLQKAVASLHATRVAFEGLAQKAKTLEEGFRSLHALLYAELDVAKKAVAQGEADVEALGLAAYNATQEKKPTPGVEVKVFTKMEYSKDDAFAWAKETKIALLPESLDVKTFEKVAPSVKPAFVTFTEVPKVQIASNLGKALQAAVVAAQVEAMPEATTDKVPF